MREIAVNMNNLMDAMEITHEDLVSYLDTETGEVVEYWGQDEDGNKLVDGDVENSYYCDNRYIRIPAIESYESYRFMEEFIPTVRNRHLQEMLEVAINGRGAFRRFKDVLGRYPDERERWFKFQRKMLEQWAIDWLRGEGIKVKAQP